LIFRDGVGEGQQEAFDDGTPLGSAENDECQIDSIPQSWAVISGAGDEQRARRAMESVEAHLIHREDRDRIDHRSLERGS
jgi:cellobiose phosphorylase